MFYMVSKVLMFFAQLELLPWSNFLPLLEAHESLQAIFVCESQLFAKDCGLGRGLDRVNEPARDVYLALIRHELAAHCIIHRQAFQRQLPGNPGSSFEVRTSCLLFDVHIICTQHPPLLLSRKDV